MTNQRKKILHLRSSQVNGDGTPKMPSRDIIDYGELAINFAAGHETLAIKNSNNEIAQFTNEVKVGGETPTAGSGVEIFIDESADPVGVDIYSKSEIDSQIEALASADAALQTSIGNKVLVGSDAGSIMIDEDTDNGVEVYTKAEVDALFAKLKQQNPSLVWE